MMSELKVVVDLIEVLSAAYRKFADLEVALGRSPRIKRGGRNDMQVFKREVFLCADTETLEGDTFSWGLSIDSRPDILTVRGRFVQDTDQGQDTVKDFGEIECRSLDELTAAVKKMADDMGNHGCSWVKDLR